MKLKLLLCSTTLLAAAVQAQPAATYYGTLGTGYSDNEPLEGFEDNNGEHVGDSYVGELSLGYRGWSDIALELGWVFESPLQGKSRPAVNQYRVNGFYFFTDDSVRPYLTAGVGYEDFDGHHAPGVDAESWLYSAGTGLEFDVTDSWFGRLEVRFDDFTDEDFEHLVMMAEVGYGFGEDRNYTPAANTDSDGDGVPDRLDQCAGTPRGKTVDTSGCTVMAADSDGDGVTDDKDRCANTPAGITVDARGCALMPVDTDGDGVTDDKDHCANTPAGTVVNARGCPQIKDSDMDGVADAEDKCPSTPRGMTVNQTGCAVFEGNLEGVTFNSGSAVLTAPARGVLDNVATELKRYPDVRVFISAHTDSQGSAVLNLNLSEKRATAVREYLIGKGVSGSRMRSQGLGETQPIADNGTAAGRAKNRRVEFKTE